MSTTEQTTEPAQAGSWFQLPKFLSFGSTPANKAEAQKKLDAIKEDCETKIAAAQKALDEAPEAPVPAEAAPATAPATAAAPAQPPAVVGGKRRKTKSAMKSTKNSKSKKNKGKKCKK